MKYTFMGIVACFLLIFGIIWLAEGTDFFLYKFFAPKKQQVEREVFEQSESYQVGMIQELEAMQIAYIKTDKNGKAAMRSIILHRADGFRGELPSNLVTFINQLKAENKEY